ncbi:MAG: hypothetical protein EZS28_030416 [Streblomastix strix]|uniref:Uncharacterized protein n=1 Tax=Streblomastix strix TaxID=222440 RepID=A0A5J4UUI6_9EUKA|nr:MAG: hypothetical protein EZS28_030416 [Streblomastix strix]
MLFVYWRRKGSNRNLTSIELQTKLTSLLTKICSKRSTENEGMSLRQLMFCQKPTKKTYDSNRKQRLNFIHANFQRLEIKLNVLEQHFLIG